MKEIKLRISLGTYDKTTVNLIKEEQKRLGNKVVFRGRGPRVIGGIYYKDLPIRYANRVAVYLIYKEKATWRSIYEI